MNLEERLILRERRIRVLGITFEYDVRCLGAEWRGTDATDFSRGSLNSRNSLKRVENCKNARFQNNLLTQTL